MVPQTGAAFVESDIYNRSTGRVTLSSAINETVSFQLVLNAPSGPQRAALVELTPLESSEARIPAEDVTVWRPIPVEVNRSPGWLLRRWPRPVRQVKYFDALAPLDGEARIQGGTALPLWIDIRVPHGTLPGNYECHIVVTEGSERRTEIPLRLRVRPFALSADAPPVVLAPLEVGPLLSRLSPRQPLRANRRLSEYDPRRDQAIELIRRTARLLHDHGLSVYVPDYKPVMKVDPTGDVHVLWEDYDAVVGSLLDGSAYADRLAARFWPLPVTAEFPDPDRYEGTGSRIFARVFSSYVAECAAHLTARGIGQGGVVLALLESAPFDRASYKTYERLATLARQAAPDLPLVTTFCPQDISRMGWHGFPPMPIPNLVDVWSPPGRLFDPREMATLAEHGRSVWLRPDEPGYTGSLMVEAPPLDARTLPWQAFAQGASAIWLYPVNQWPTGDTTTVLRRVPPNHADWLVYPGEIAGLTRTLPSVRLKRLRRGIQDLRYLELLRRHGRPQIARLLAETLFKAGSTDAYGDHFADTRPFGWVEDASMWALARRLAAEQIERAIQREVPSQEQAQVHELEWRRLQGGCRKLRLFVEGVALRFGRGKLSTELSAEAHILLVNELQDALVGTLRFGDVRSQPFRPADGQEEHDRQSWAGTIEAVEPVSCLARRARIVVDDLPASVNGHLSVPVSFDAGAAGTIQAQGRLAYVVPLKLPRPLVLDGDLSDWPSGVGNSAGAFRLIGGGPRRAGETQITDIPTQETRVYLAANDHHLFFAFDCREERMDALNVGMSNVVRYDGLTPVGEDFVEIVIDPTNARTRSTSDVYHLLIKANGVVLSHRGTPCDPPTGEHEIWFGGAEAQVRHGPAGWTAEVRLPLDAFPPEARGGSIWAVNFARFESRLDEYSNWAGAKRHIYSPRSMGNLIWPEHFRPREPVQPAREVLRGNRREKIGEELLRVGLELERVMGTVILRDATLRPG